MTVHRDHAADLETPLAPEPVFYVEPTPADREGGEMQRQTEFLRLMRYAAPRVLVYANANAGKRARHVARREGIRSGVSDLTCVWRGKVAWIELKGFDKRGRPGKLSDNQIEFGNRLVGLGHPVACFFSPHRAVDWLREQGFPIAQVHS